MQPETNNYLVRHWYGDLSLPVSYFVNSILLSALLAIMVNAINYYQDTDPDLQTIVYIWSGILFGLVVIGVWQLVGIWRSASKHPSRGGKRLWAGIAKFLVVIGAIHLATQTGNAYQSIGQGYQALKSANQDFEINIIRDGEAVEVVGTFNSGIAKEFELVIDDMPALQTVEFQSRGGLVNEAQRIRKLIRARHLNTLVMAECASACTLAFLGGKQRFLGPDGLLGFHAPSFHGLSNDDAAGELLALADTIPASEVDKAFTIKAYVTTFLEMWHPTTDELLEAGFIHGLQTGTGTAQQRNWTRRDITIAGFVQQPILKAFHNAFPDAFERLVDAYVKADTQGQSEEEAIQLIAEHTTAMMQLALGRAATPELLAFTRLVIEQLDAFHAAGPDACAMIVAKPEESTKELLGEGFWQKLSQATLDAVTSTVDFDHPGFTQSQALDLFQNFFDAVEARSGLAQRDLIATTISSPENINQTEFCSSMAALYREVLAQPDENAAELLRLLKTEAFVAG